MHPAAAIPSSACLRAKAICSSVNLLFFTTCSCPLGAFITPALSVTERFGTLGQGQLAARRLNQGKFVWPKDVAGTLALTRAQLDAFVLGLPGQRMGEAGVITVL